VTKMMGTVILAVVMAASIHAQDKPTPAAEQKIDVVPQVSAQDKQIVQALDLQRTGYAIAIAARQEKLDAVNAELGRTVQRLQTANPGYELGPGLTYVKRVEPPKAPIK
jgi:Skp family chaperone for outer membrane proteins